MQQQSKGIEMKNANGKKFNGKKVSISDLEGTTIAANDCRGRIRVGGLEEFPWHSDWQTGWYLDEENVIQVGVAYQRRVLTDNPHGSKGGGIVSLQDSDLEDIRNQCDGSPEEMRDRAGRERRARHELLLWRLEKTQAAVDLAVQQGTHRSADLGKIAEDAFKH